MDHHHIVSLAQPHGLGRYSPLILAITQVSKWTQIDNHFTLLKVVREKHIAVTQVRDAWHAVPGFWSIRDLPSVADQGARQVPRSFSLASIRVVQ
jgi:hypothetical protein